jgi:hypothetical protein
MEKAINATMDGSLPIRGESRLICLLCSRTKNVKSVSSGLLEYPEFDSEKKDITKIEARK